MFFVVFCLFPQRQSSKFDLCTTIGSDAAPSPSSSGKEVATSPSPTPSDHKTTDDGMVNFFGDPPDVTRLSLGQVGIARLARPQSEVFTAEPGAVLGTGTRLFLSADGCDPVLSTCLGEGGNSALKSVHTIAQMDL